jgi:hypothetical protein
MAAMLIHLRGSCKSLGWTCVMRESETSSARGDCSRSYQPFLIFAYVCGPLLEARKLSCQLTLYTVGASFSRHGVFV